MGTVVSTEEAYRMGMHVNGTNGVKEKLANGSVDGLTDGANGYTNGSRA